MKLWRITRAGGFWNLHDEYLEFMVRARTENDARMIVHREVVGAQARVPWMRRDVDWRNPKHASCERITESGPAEIVMAEFLPG